MSKVKVLPLGVKWSTYRTLAVDAAAGVVSLAAAA
jgi:hypothetical protein